MKPIHIAIASTTSKPGAVADNLAQIAGFVEQASRDGANLLLTPELSASGYGPYPQVLATAERAGTGPIFQSLARMARQSRVVVAAGFVELSDAKRYLAHYIVYPDGRYLVQRKHRVMLTEWPLDPAGELIAPDPAHPSADPADPGQPRAPHFEFFEIKGVRCALAICADSGIPTLNDLLAQARIELLLLPTGAGGQRQNRVTSQDLRTDAGRQKYLQRLQEVFFPGASILDCIKHRRALAAGEPVRIRRPKTLPRRPRLDHHPHGRSPRPDPRPAQPRPPASHVYPCGG